MAVIEIMKETALLVEKQEISTEEKANVLVEISKVEDVVKAKDKEIMVWQQRFNAQQAILGKVVEEKKALQARIVELEGVPEPDPDAEPDAEPIQSKET